MNSASGAGARLRPFAPPPYPLRFPFPDATPPKTPRTARQGPQMTKNDPKSKAPATHAADDHHDDLIIVPKGRSKRQFLFTLGLTIFVLIIFTVGSEFQNTAGGMFGGGGRNPVYLSWTDPITKEKKEVRREPFDVRYGTLRDFSAIGLFGTLHPPREDDAARRPQVQPEDAALFLILEDIADTYDIQIADRDFQQFLRSAFGNRDGVVSRARQLRMTPAAFLTELRRFLRCDSVLRLMQAGTSIAPDPALVEEAWEENHPQFRFEVVGVGAEEFLEAATAEAPEGDELVEWFRARPQWEQEKHYTEAKFKPVVAWFPVESGWDATALLEEYPPVEGVDPEGQAENYHRIYSNTRFKLEPDEDNGEGDGDGDGEGEEASEDDPDDPAPLYEDYEAVADICRVEAPINAALTNWLSDLRARQGDPEAAEPVDFAAEAEALGLTVTTPETALTKAEIEEAEGWGGKNIAMRFFPRMTAETFVSTPVVEEDAMMVVWVAEVEPRQEPPFEEIRAAVAEDWAKQRSKELAVERLEALRDTLGDRPAEEDEQTTWYPTATSEEFAAAAATLDLEVRTRPFLERGESADDEDFADFDNFLSMMGRPLYELEPGQVAPAQADLQGENVFLVRLAEKRTRPFEEMTAKAFFGGLQNQALSKQMQAFRSEVLRLDSDWFKTTFAVELDHWDRPDFVEQPLPEDGAETGDEENAGLGDDE